MPSPQEQLRLLDLNQRLYAADKLLLESLRDLACRAYSEGRGKVYGEKILRRDKKGEYADAKEVWCDFARQYVGYFGSKGFTTIRSLLSLFQTFDAHALTREEYAEFLRGHNAIVRRHKDHLTAERLRHKKDCTDSVTPQALDSDFYLTDAPRLDNFTFGEEALQAAADDYVQVGKAGFSEKTLKKLLYAQSINNTYMEGALHFLAICGTLERTKGKVGNAQIYFSAGGERAPETLYTRYLQAIDPPPVVAPPRSPARLPAEAEA